MDSFRVRPLWHAAAPPSDPQAPDCATVNPPQEHVQGDSWWTDYQAVSYQLASKHGNRAQFANMVKTCHTAGVGVIVGKLPVLRASSRRARKVFWDGGHDGEWGSGVVRVLSGCGTRPDRFPTSETPVLSVVQASCQNRSGRRWWSCVHRHYLEPHVRARFRDRLCRILLYEVQLPRNLPKPGLPFMPARDQQLEQRDRGSDVRACWISRVSVPTSLILRGSLTKAIVASRQRRNMFAAGWHSMGTTSLVSVWMASDSMPRSVSPDFVRRTVTLLSNPCRHARR